MSCLWFGLSDLCQPYIIFFKSLAPKKSSGMQKCQIWVLKSQKYFLLYARFGISVHWGGQKNSTFSSPKFIKYQSLYIPLLLSADKFEGITKVWIYWLGFLEIFLWKGDVCMMHSVGIVSQFAHWTLDEIEDMYILPTRSSRGEKVCIRGSEHISFKILE